MRWLNPEYLLLLLVAGWLAWRIFARPQTRPAIRFSATAALRAIPRTFTERMRHLPGAVRIGALALMIVAMARPQAGQVERHVTSRGIDIVLILDVSGSMRARDFEPDRLGAAKEVIKSFVQDRKGDRISVVAFAGSAFTLCPATLDVNVINEFVDRIQAGVIEQDGTALGMGLATALKSLKGSDAPGRIAILLTDGVNNTGTIQPLQAAEAAKALGVRTYTIGVGSEGVALYPFVDRRTGREVLQPVQVDIDEKSLQEIAKMTGAKYYRATDKHALREIYEDIDKIEKTKHEYIEYDMFDELAPWLLWPALALLLLDLLIAPTRLGGLP